MNKKKANKLHNRKPCSQLTGKEIKMANTF